MTGFVPDAGQPQATTTDSSAFSVGALAGTMMSTAAVANTQSQVQKLVDSAKSGGFAINEEGADEYIRVFQDISSHCQPPVAKRT
ncbi:hypothetical protein FPZ12_001325 [Amycolatopsis acidicola]|uniref:Uncharacterized protein n=1 Tax=Amycolatopsis acidicola TaxID=2596893 RepID=A0A5N0VMS2_9PSEU|nr:hypothetical protein [Amycolatopsis acidicola]KAA9166863.1 hypothetical protein FPZ12_001325 [Amycolatopsis acidicola]